MQTPLDLKHYKASDHEPLGSYQLVPPPVAAWALVYGLIVGLILAPFIK